MQEPINMPEHNPGEPPKTDQKPFSQPKVRRYALIFGIIGLLGVIAVAALAFALSRPAANQQSNQQTQPTPSEATTQGSVDWESKGDGTWAALGGTAPTCSNPIFTQSPTDVSKATAVLYPGQMRGGNYKPHGGLRFDGQANDAVTVKMPFDGTIYRGSQYIEGGELQYLFDVVNPCGYMIRFDHLSQLSDAFKTAASKLPAATESTRTERIMPEIKVKAGDVVATAVGFTKNKNVNFDFGVYDLRVINAAAKAPAYQQAHQNDKDLSWHAVCLFDVLPSADAAKVKSLPAGDQASGKQSDYCQ
jgi:hypothetical protein